MCRVCPRPLKTHFYRKPAVPVASVIPPDLRARLETTLRRPPKIEKMENSQSFTGGLRRPCGSPPYQSHIASSLDPHTSSGGPGRGSDPFGLPPPSTRTHLGRSRSSSTPRTTFSRPGTSSRTAPRRATATWGPRRRRGAIWAAPATMALTTSPSPIRTQLSVAKGRPGGTKHQHWLLC